MSASRPQRQRGYSLMGMVLLAMVVALVGMLGSMVAGAVAEFWTVQKIVNRVKDADTVRDVRTDFDKYANLNGISSVTSKDLTISIINDRPYIEFAYRRELPLAGPVSLLINFAGHSK